MCVSIYLYIFEYGRKGLFIELLAFKKCLFIYLYIYHIRDGWRSLLADIISLFIEFRETVMSDDM